MPHGDLVQRDIFTYVMQNNKTPCEKWMLTIRIHAIFLTLTLNLEFLDATFRIAITQLKRIAWNAERLLGHKHDLDTWPSVDIKVMEHETPGRLMGPLSSVPQLHMLDFRRRP